MTKKMIYFSSNQIARIQKDANEREISFTEMVRRILDRYYEEIDKMVYYQNYKKQQFTHLKESE
jgi:hypothetical protein